MLDLNGVRLRNRVVTSASLLGYGAKPESRFFPYGMSPVGQFLPLERFGAVTTRTMTFESREGHFTTRTDWGVRDWPGLLRRYSGALRPIDGGWMNAFGWSNIGVEAYFRDYFPRTGHLNRIVSLGGFSAEEFTRLVAYVNERVEPGEIAAVELNVSCHNVNFGFDAIIDEVLAEAVPMSRHPVILKLSPDGDYLAVARLAEERGVAALTAVNTVKGLRLDPETGEPFMRNRYGGMSGRCIKPICLRVVSELREGGIRLPIVATGGIRTFDDAREYFWAGADAVSLGSEAFLASWPGYLASPLKARALVRTLKQVERYEPELARRRSGEARAETGTRVSAAR
jgi:dihydroorotate dehydrogenase (NAD+) catalytic subunit